MTPLGPSPATLTKAIAAFSLFCGSVLADIGFSSPSAGETISGSTINVEFADGSGTPSISQFTSYTLQLCAGGNSDSEFTPILTFTSQGDPSSTTYTAKIPDLSVGGNTKNAYFLRTIGVAPGGTVYNYSDRFTLSGMTGQFSSTVQAALQDVSGTAGPATENKINAAAGSAPAAAGPAQFNVPYGQQTGAVYYAPMAVMAPSQITAKGDARQYPTSAYTPWPRSGNPQPNVQNTVTQPVTYSVQSMEPTIAPAPQPSNDMQKFLNRWKD